MRVAIRIKLSHEEREVLLRWSRGRSTPMRQVLRAKIVLMAAEGKMNKEIAAALQTDAQAVKRWRTRFAAQRLAGVKKDAQRGGSELMGDSVDLVSEAGMAFEGFSLLIELSVNTAREVAGSMDFQVKTSEEMTRAIAGIKVVSAQLAARTTEIEKSAQQLLKLGQELKNLTTMPGN